ncbi:MAG: hypothetical protein EXX96DRAFT_502625 [Benjaminiella poitrasii]|nr:MAG: hypothetical protein EXX96DRAFT_502625 [Benjaminiella poitrasii]
MSHQSMSINQMLQPKEEGNNSEYKLLGKVKIFYTFKGSDTHCLCTFDVKLDDYKDKKWIGVPLKQCLTAVCSSCPDQLINTNTAIYSANFEESLTVENWTPLHDSQTNIIWEGHGILSNILNDENQNAQVTGKVSKSDKSSQYDCYIEVLIQLHPIRHSPLQQNHAENQHYLPPMRSIWSEPMNSTYSSPAPSNTTNMSSATSPTTSERQLQQPTAPYQTFHPNRQPPLHSLPYHMQRDDSLHRLPSLNSPLSRDLHKEDPNYPVYPPALDPDWPGSRYDSSSFDHEVVKRRRITLSNSNLTQTNDIEENEKKRTSPNYNDGLASTAHPSLPPNPVSTSSMPTNIMRSSLTTTRINPSFDTYYHQSRRKKRDTKPPNVNDIRPFVEVEKGPDGKYILPAEVDSWTVLCLGTVVWDKAAFHNQRYIYPVGYRVKKWYRSMVDPHSDTQYTCEILDGGDEPIFQLNADDNPNECWRGPTPTTVWTIAVRRAFAIRNMGYGHNPVGPDFFGLRKNTIAKMIQDLPDADKCKNYIWQNFEAMNNTKGKSVRRTNPRPSTSYSSSSVALNESSSKLQAIDENESSTTSSSVKSENQ